MSQSRSAAGGELSFKTRLLYGSGTIAFGVKDQGFNALLMLFYNQVIGLPAAWVGSAIMIAMIADALFDPLLGQYSDNFRSRLGRRHPFMYAAALPIGIFYLLLWSPPDASDTVQFAWLVVTAIFVRFSISLYEIPSTALLAEFTSDYDERTKLVAARFFFGVCGGLGSKRRGLWGLRLGSGSHHDDIGPHIVVWHAKRSAEAPGSATSRCDVDVTNAEGNARHIGAPFLCVGPSRQSVFCHRLWNQHGSANVFFDLFLGTERKPDRHGRIYQRRRYILRLRRGPASVRALRQKAIRVVDVQLGAGFQCNSIGLAADRSVSSKWRTDVVVSFDGSVRVYDHDNHRRRNSGGVDDRRRDRPNSAGDRAPVRGAALFRINDGKQSGLGDGNSASGSLARLRQFSRQGTTRTG
jgi:hypothetical protein